MGRWKKLLSLDQLSASSSICVPRGRIVPALGVFLAASLLLFYLLGPIYGGNAAASFGTSWGGVSSLFSTLSGYSGLLGGAGNASVGAGHRSSDAAEAHIIEEKGGVVMGNSTAEDRKGGGPMIAEAPAAANGTVSSSGGREGEENPVFAQGQRNKTAMANVDKDAAAPIPGENDELASSSSAVVPEISPALAPATAYSLMPGNATSLAKGDVSDSHIQGEAAAASPSPRNKKCDIFDGRWVRDEARPYYPPGSCPHIDVYFDCHKNGRPDDDYLKWRWQPHGCNLPRLNATKFLELLRGKRLIFVGDSLNRNMWESLVCILRHAIADKKRVYEKSGRSQFKARGFYSFIFKDYSCSIDYVRSTFLVREVYFKGSHAPEGDRLRLDVMDDTTSAYREADIVVFNTGHWWTHEKTSEGKDYYQEGNHVYPVLNVMDAFKKALSTWARWVDKNINAKKTHVIFRGYSLTHFSGGQWNSGGQCHKETEPIFNDAYLVKYPKKMRAVEDILAKMKTPVTYLNISRLTDYRKDGHPSIYRETYSSTADPKAAEATQDCSHWCLPGIPDTWNELLYASLVMDDKISL